MSRLPSLSARDLIRVAERLGSVFDRQKGGHAVYRRAADHRRLVVPMRGSRDLKPGTVRGLIEDMGLSVEEFAAML